MAKDTKLSKKVISDEVTLAWEAIKRKPNPKAEKGKEEKEKSDESEEKENLEETIIPKEKSEFISTLPEKAPSLEFTKQNLESSLGPRTANEEKKEEDEKGYQSPKSYIGKKQEKYNRLEFAENITVKAPTAFSHPDLSERTVKGRHMHIGEFISGKQEQMLDYTVKDFRNGAIELDESKKAKKYVIDID